MGLASVAGLGPGPDGLAGPGGAGMDMGETWPEIGAEGPITDGGGAGIEAGMAGIVTRGGVRLGITRPGSAGPAVLFQAGAMGASGAGFAGSFPPLPPEKKARPLPRKRRSTANLHPPKE